MVRVRDMRAVAACALSARPGLVRSYRVKEEGREVEEQAPMATSPHGSPIGSGWRCCGCHHRGGHDGQDGRGGLRRRAEGGGRPPVELGRSGRRCSGQVVAAEAKSRRGDESARPEAHARAPSASREAPDRITRWGPLVAFVLSAPPRWGWRAQCAPLPLRMSA